MPTPTRLQTGFAVGVVVVSGFFSGLARIDAELLHQSHEPGSIVVMDLPMQQSYSQSSNYTMPGMYGWG